MKVTAQSTQFSDVGVHQFEFHVSLISGVLADASYTLHTDPFTFTVVDACDTTIIDPIVFDPDVSTLAIALPTPNVGTDEINIPNEP